MAISWSRSTSEGDWLGASGTTWWQAVTLGPAGFEAYARVRSHPGPRQPRSAEAEADVELPEDHPRDFDQALAALAPFTGTPPRLPVRRLGGLLQRLGAPGVVRADPTESQPFCF